MIAEQIAEQIEVKPATKLELVKQEEPFVPFFTGKRKGVQWYRGQRWYGPANKVGQRGAEGRMLLVQLPDSGGKPIGPFGVMPL
jgi:hypothetical protein